MDELDRDNVGGCIQNKRDLELDKDWYPEEDEDFGGESEYDDVEDLPEEPEDGFEEEPSEMELDDEYLTNGKAKSSVILHVDPNALLNEIKDYYHGKPFSKNLADMIFAIAENMARRVNFSGYSWRDEMVLDGYEKMALSIYNKKFDLTKNFSPFSYLSRICWRSFVLRIKKEKQIKDTEADFRQKMYEKIRQDNSGINFKESEYNGEKIYLIDTTDAADDDWN